MQKNISLYGQYPNVRLRRLRHNPQLRALIRETKLSAHDFILPLFIHHGVGIRNPIQSMPNHFQLSLDRLAEEIQTIQQLGCLGVILFGIPSAKDANGCDAISSTGIIQQAIHVIKEIAPELLVITDVCLCEYTDHGHCGVIQQEQGSFDVNNDATLHLLQQQALSHVQAGADIIAPSGMMDGVVCALRQVLDDNNYQHIPILSYAMKFASAYYGPFREAAQGAPQFGDRQSYQADPANRHEALREVALDVAEGADMLMVKPALVYLDIIYQVKQQYPAIPLAAYQVSGEYAMLKAAANNGWVNEKNTVLESLLAIKRAGADFIISYYTKEAIRWLTD